MKKQIIAALSTHLYWGALVLILLLLGFQVIPRSLGQRDKGKEWSVSADAAQPGRAVTVALPPTKTQDFGGDLPTVGCTLGSWNTSTTGPATRYRAGGTTDGTYVYVYGGSNAAAQYLNDLWRWNPATQTWTQLANMPTGKSNIQGTYWNGKIYVPGGYTGVHITENAIYDIGTNTWSTGAPLPAAQSGQTVAYNNKIYNFGGNPGPVNTTSIYDIATNTWSTGAAMPATITYGRAIRSGNYAYYAGGIAGATTNTVYRYDFAANSWSTMSPLQTARTSEELMASPDGSVLFAVMGGDATFFTGVPLAQSVEIYDIAANSWSYGNPVVTKAAAPSGGLAGGKVMVQGGVDNVTYYDTVQVSVLSSGCAATCPPGSWTIKPTYPTMIESPGVASNGASLYATGGFDPNLGGPTNAFNRYDPST